MPGRYSSFIHPLLFALYPVLFYYDLNKHEMFFSATLRSIFLVIGAAGLGLLLFRALLGTIQKAAVLTSLCLVLFFFYGSLVDRIPYIELGGAVVGNQFLALAGYAIILTCAVLSIRRTQSALRGATQFLNTASLALVLFPIASILVYQFNVSGSGAKQQEPTMITASTGKETKKTETPDIYYIILDAYARRDALKTFYGFDNGGFIEHLRNTGFYVADKSRANYPVTLLSLPSSLNMNYLDPLTRPNEENGSRFVPVKPLIENHLIMRFLKSRGYTYLHFSSGSEATNANRYADQTISYAGQPSRFEEYLAKKTFLSALKLDFLDNRQIKRNVVLHTLKQLESVPQNPNPTFAFAHILMPHEPYVFDQNGDIPQGPEGIISMRGYLGHLSYANKLVKKLVAKILSDSKTPPVIILQADHGTLQHYQGLVLNEMYLKERMGILNAYYAPGIDVKKFYPTISPVNTFRLIFNHYFGTQMELLPDRSYYAYYDKNAFLPILLPEESDLPRGPGDFSRSAKWIEALETSVQEFPDHGFPSLLLGYKYFELGQYEKAVAQLEKSAGASFSDVAASWLYLGRAYQKMGRDSQAIQTFEKALEKPQRHLFYHFIHNDLGALYLKANRLEEAIESFQQALDLDPMSAVALKNLGTAYLKAQNLKPAVYTFKRALRLDPTSVFAHTMLGKTYEALGESQKARDVYDRAAELSKP